MCCYCNFHSLQVLYFVSCQKYQVCNFVTSQPFFNLTIEGSFNPWKVHIEDTSYVPGIYYVLYFSAHTIYSLLAVNLWLGGTCLVDPFNLWFMLIYAHIHLPKYPLPNWYNKICNVHQELGDSFCNDMKIYLNNICFKHANFPRQLLIWTFS